MIKDAHTMFSCFMIFGNGRQHLPNYYLQPTLNGSMLEFSRICNFLFSQKKFEQKARDQ